MLEEVVRLRNVIAWIWNHCPNILFCNDKPGWKGIW